MKTLDLTGNRYGRLLVLGRSPSSNRYVRWACLCDCGTLISANRHSLTKWERLSCGCLQRENPGARKQHDRAMRSLHSMSWRQLATEIKWAANRSEGSLRQLERTWLWAYYVYMAERPPLLQNHDPHYKNHRRADQRSPH